MAFGRRIGEMIGYPRVSTLDENRDLQIRWPSIQCVRQYDWSAQLSGRISGIEVGKTYMLSAPDETATAKAYGVITTSEGEVITAEGFQVNSPIANGFKFLSFVHLTTSSQKYAWVNTRPIAVAGEANATGFSATSWEWEEAGESSGALGYEILFSRLQIIRRG